MLTRPFYKKILAAFGVSKAEAVAVAKPPIQNKVSEFPLSPPPAPRPRKLRSGTTKATKGAFGKCRYVIDTHPVTDPAFNHSLRRKA